MRFTHQGPQARGCVNRVETDTEWYNRLIPWAKYPWQRIMSLATIASAIKDSSACLATIGVQIPPPTSVMTVACSTLISPCHVAIQNYDTIAAVCSILAGHCVDSQLEWSTIVQNPQRVAHRYSCMLQSLQAKPATLLAVLCIMH